MSDQIRELPDEIAVISLTGRFPDARNLEEFWRNLRDGVESIPHSPTRSSWHPKDPLSPIEPR